MFWYCTFTGVTNLISAKIVRMLIISVGVPTTISLLFEMSNNSGELFLCIRHF
jgi:hypothetical protein